MLRSLGAAALLFLSVLLCSLAPSRASVSSIVYAFGEIAFGTEDPRERLGERLRRWDGPIRLHIREPQRLWPWSSEDARRVADQLELYAMLAGLSFEWVDDGRQANFHVLLAGSADAYAEQRREYDQNEGVHCFGRLFMEESGVIREARIVLPTFRGQDVRDACIVQELAQALGLVNDSPNVSPSNFNDYETYTAPTWLDLCLLQLLYHPGLRTGMTARSALPVVADILRQEPPDMCTDSPFR